MFGAKKREWGRILTLDARCQVSRVEPISISISWFFCFAIAFLHLSILYGFPLLFALLVLLCVPKAAAIPVNRFHDVPNGVICDCGRVTQWIDSLDESVQCVESKASCIAERIGQ